MGSGAEETAASAQALLDRFQCDWAFSLGPAGALAEAVETGRWYRVAKAVACANHGVPLFSGKGISDQADENAAKTFQAFLASYSGEGGLALAEVIQSLPPNSSAPSSYPAIEKALREIGADGGLTRTDGDRSGSP